MTAPAQNSPDILCAEILAEARRESEEILRRAKAEAEKILAAASAEAEKIRREKREQAQAEATRRSEMILATVAVEAGRLRAARIEELLESIREEIRRRLQTREFDAREVIIVLAAEAVRQMPGSDLTLKISVADHAAFGGGLAAEIVQRSLTGRMSVPQLIIAADATMTDGVVVESADGLQIWDNRLALRLERLWPELRRQIATQTSLVAPSETSGASMISESNILAEERTDARQRLGVRQPSGAFTPTAKAAEDCRSPKPGGGSDKPGKGDA